MSRADLIFTGKSPKTIFFAWRALFPIVIILLLGSAFLLQIISQRPTTRVERHKDRTRVYFTPYMNPGRGGTKVFYAGGAGYGFTLAGDHISYSFIEGVPKQRRRPSNPGAVIENETGPPDKPKTFTLDVNFVGANSNTRLTGAEKQPGKVNILLGNDPRLWQRHLPTYSRAVYMNLYPGIDMSFSGSQKSIKYAFSVAPQANHRKIKLRYTGARSLRIDRKGNLIINAPSGTLRDRKPTAYQEIGGHRVNVDAAFSLNRNVIGFTVPDYDPNYTLYIDPQLEYATFIGQSGSDIGESIVLDDADNVYVTGYSPAFPTTAGAYDTGANGGNDVFVTKLASDGSSLVYSTYVGGSSAEWAMDIAVDDGGNAYVTGETQSSNYPTTGTPAPFDSTHNGNRDAFITKLNPSGANITYSTFLGSSGWDYSRGIAVDSGGNAYVAGRTLPVGWSSSNFPVTAGAYDTTYEQLGHNAVVLTGDAFIAKVNASGSSLIYSTFFGGNDVDEADDITIDSTGNAYFTGLTRPSSVFPTTPDAFDRTYNEGEQDAFAAKLSADGSSLLYSTYLGGSGTDGGNGIAIDSMGNAFVAGYTNSTNFPTTPEAFDQTYNGGFDFSYWGDSGDAFVVKLNDDGGALHYATYIGGIDFDGGTDVKIDSAGYAYFTGETWSPDLPTTAGAYDRILGDGAGLSDAFVGRLSPMGSNLIYGTFFGGSNTDWGEGLALGSANEPYIIGGTASSNMTTTAGAYDTVYNGSNDVFIAKFDLPPITTLSAMPPVPNGQNSWYTVAPVIALSADETASIYYQWDSTSSISWTPFATGFNPPEGGGTLYYFAVDTQSNTEPISYQPYKVDTISPDTSTISGSPAGPTAIDLSWTPGSDAGSGVRDYSIYDADSNALITASTTTNISISGLAPNTTYRYYVKANDNAGNVSGPSNVAVVMTVVDTAPPSSAKIIGFVPSAPAPGARIDLFWTKAIDDVGVVGYALIDADTSSQLATTTISSRDMSGLSPGTPYAYKVKAFDSWNNTAADSNVIIIDPGRGGTTPVGYNIAVNPDPGLTVVFDNIIAGGTTSVDRSSTPAAPPPAADIRFFGEQMDITTTASFDMTLTVAIKYPNSFTKGNESTVKLYHFTAGAWSDVTDYLDMDNNVVVGRVSSLSPFIFGEQPPPAVGQASQGWFKVSPLDPIGSIDWQSFPENSGFQSPHAGFSTTSNLCKTCHAVHNADRFSYRLLKSGSLNFEAGPDRSAGEGSAEGAGNARATECMYCHDASAGLTVKKPYDLSISGITVRGEHTLGASVVPDSDINGGGNLANRDAAGEGAVLQCYQCHSVHGANTIGAGYSASDSIESWDTKILRLDPAGDGSVLAKGSGGLTAADWESELSSDPAAVRTGFCVDCHNLNPNWARTPDDTDRPNKSSHPQGRGLDGLMQVNNSTSIGVALHLDVKQGCRGCHAAGNGSLGAGNFPHQSQGWKLMWNSYTTTKIGEGAGDPQRVTPGMDKTCLFCHPLDDIETYGGYNQSEETACYRCHNEAEGSAYSAGSADLERQLNKASRHPTETYAGRHTTLEDIDPIGALGAANRHAECLDCHDVARMVRGVGRPLLGIWGVDIVSETTNNPPALATIDSVQTQWQLCLKCHSSYTTRPSSSMYESTNTSSPGFTPITQGDKALEFNAKNSAFHPVRTAGRSQSANLDQQLLGGLTIASLVACTDCHNADETSATPGPASNSPFTPKGPHGSTSNTRLATPNNLVLRAFYWTGYRDASTSADPIWAAPPSFASANFDLCFKCHDYDKLVGFTRWSDGARTNFYQGNDLPPTYYNLHRYHLINYAGAKISCRNCHYNIHSNQTAANTQYKHNKNGTWVITNTPPDGVKTHLVSFSPDVAPQVGFAKPQWEINVTNSIRSCSLKCHGGSNPGNMSGSAYRPPTGDDSPTY